MTLNRGFHPVDPTPCQNLGLSNSKAAVRTIHNVPCSNNQRTELSHKICPSSVRDQEGEDLSDESVKDCLSPGDERKRPN